MTEGTDPQLYHMLKGAFFIFAVCMLAIKDGAYAQLQTLDSAWHHIRNGSTREWSDFPAEAQMNKYVLDFPSGPHDEETTLVLRQYDVKGTWRVVLNGEHLGILHHDEKDLLRYFRVPPGALKANNQLEISSSDAQADDIKVGEVLFDARPLTKILAEAHVDFEIVDEESNERVPSRITIVNGRGILQEVAPAQAAPLAIRPGHVYTGNGEAILGLPAGTYTFYASRGFEYGVDTITAVLTPGGHLQHKFTLRREVSTSGWVSSDTHIHTFTWSRHGDATVAERVLTIAGEGLELPVMTDHNLHVDAKPFAIDQSVDRYFTPVIGNEVTTSVGHFNIFPASGQVANHRGKDWKTLSQQLGDKTSRAIILNHARDIHLGFRPFDPSLQIASAGTRLDGWDLPANAMEVINSGSQQTDQMQLTHDWFSMLNGGHIITPVGASDSHDVSRFIVGQARTYIRSDDEDPAGIDVTEAVKNFLEGNVMVSFGLLAEIEINDSYGPGELAPASDEVKIAVTVSGPAWAWAEKVSLYANGKKIRETSIVDKKAAGQKWTGVWNLTVPPHDIYLVAIAEGPGRNLAHWPIARPYQPTSPEWNPRVFGLSGAVWVDGDKNEKRDPAANYAQNLWRQSGGNVATLIQSLAAYDESISVQAAALLHKNRMNLKSPDMVKALRRASPETRSAFQTVIRDLDAANK